MKTTLLIIILFVIQAGHAQQKREHVAEELYLDSLIQKQVMEKSMPSLAIGIVKDGKVVMAEGYGYANMEDRVPASAYTVYQIGSVTKMFTGHLLAQLIHAQKMSITDTLAGYFPAGVVFPESPAGEQVTIKEIATHSAEFPRYPENLHRTDPDPIRGYSKQQLMEGIESVVIDTAIGIRYNYSNFGYGVLGAAMENRMGKSLAVLMEDYIFVPYHLNSTSLVLKEELNENLAVPYLEVSPMKRTEPWNMEALSAAGNAFSSVSDLNTFMIKMLLDNQVNRIQQQRYFQINDTWHYGLGCFVIDSQKRNTRIIYHGGDIDGYASSLTLCPEYDLGFVMLTNWGEGQLVGEVFTKISDKILNHYLGKPGE